MCVGLCAPYAYRSLWRPEKDIEVPGTEVTVVSHSVGAGN